MDLKPYIRDMPDFPKPGIIFKDIAPLLANPAAFAGAIDALAGLAEGLGCDAVAGMESRGFLFGMPLAMRLQRGFIPIRKKGKLPGPVLDESYALEYGTAVQEIQIDAVKPGMRVLLVDDVLATGGTAAAAARLIEKAGGSVSGLLFLVELGFLNGRAPLAGRTVRSVITYE